VVNRTPVVGLQARKANQAEAGELTVVRGYGWSVFGLVIVTFLIVAIASAVIRAVFAPLPNFLDAWLGGLVAHSVTVPFAAAALTTAYFALTRGAADETPAAAN
jgi:hypothetical protein